jgi:hypothetical protein
MKVRVLLRTPFEPITESYYSKNLSATHLLVFLGPSAAALRADFDPRGASPLYGEFV